MGINKNSSTIIMKATRKFNGNYNGASFTVLFFEQFDKKTFRVDYLSDDEGLHETWIRSGFQTGYDVELEANILLARLENDSNGRDLLWKCFGEPNAS